MGEKIPSMLTTLAKNLVLHSTNLLYSTVIGCGCTGHIVLFYVMSPRPLILEDMLLSMSCSVQPFRNVSDRQYPHAPNLIVSTASVFL